MKAFIKEYKWWLSSIIVIAIIFGCLLKISVGFINTTSHPKSESQTNNYKKDKKEMRQNKNMSVLIVGKDKQDQSGSRTDAIILATFNSKSKSVKMVRIPRDVYADYHGYKGKINGIYNQSGIKGLKRATEAYTGVPITHYVTTDFDGLEQIVNTIDGIKINSNIDVNSTSNPEIGKGIDIHKGETTFNGKEALAYSRVRHIDDDIARGERQEQVLKGIKDKLTSPEQLPHVNRNLKMIMKYVDTDLSLNDILNYAPELQNDLDVETLQFEWNGFEQDGVSYVKIPYNERIKIANQLRKHLGMSTINQDMSESK